MVAVTTSALVFAQTPPTQNRTGRVIVASAAGHADASDASPVLGHITYGTRIEIRGDRNGWLQVQLPEDRRLGGLRPVGYIKGTAVNFADAPAPGMSMSLTRLPVETKMAGGLTVAADAAGQTVWLPGIAARVVPIAEPLPTLAAIVGSASLPRALAGDTVMPPSASADVTWTWVVQAGSPAPALPGDRPEFSVFFGEASTSTPTRVTPVVVRLATSSAAQSVVVAAARGRVDLPVRDVADWPLANAMIQNVIPVTFVSSSQTILTGRVARPLEAGQYAVVLRPRAASVAGAQALADDGEGLVIAKVFRFRVGQ